MNDPINPLVNFGPGLSREAMEIGKLREYSETIKSDLQTLMMKLDIAIATGLKDREMFLHDLRELGVKLEELQDAVFGKRTDSSDQGIKGRSAAHEDRLKTLEAKDSRRIGAVWHFIDIILGALLGALAIKFLT